MRLEIIGVKTVATYSVESSDVQAGSIEGWQRVLAATCSTAVEDLLVTKRSRSSAKLEPCTRIPLANVPFPETKTRLLSSPIVTRAPVFLLFGCNKGALNKKGKRVTLRDLEDKLHILL